MFDNLTSRLSRALHFVSGCAYLTENNIKETLRELRMALLEADVSLPVVHNFIDSVKKKAIGREVHKNLTPSQEFVKIIRDELVLAMGEKNKTLNLAIRPPAVLLLVGLQGTGKTASIGKLGRFIREKYKKKVLAVSADIYRPAAIKQLEIIAYQAGVDFFQSNISQNPIDIVNSALKNAKVKFYDVLLIDTAGCLHTNKVMIDEIRQIKNIAHPIETLLVVDATTGQDAANIAKIFDEVLSITGVVLTKVDSDARGGAALSVRYIIGKPIKFLGVGEKTEALEVFYPERIASRILGMGDVLSLIEDIEKRFDRVHVRKLASKLKNGEDFNLIDFLEQLRQIKNMGDITGLINKIPGVQQITKNVKEQVNSSFLIQAEAIINSMTLKERSNPSIIKGSRKRRIAVGCGVQVQDVNRLLKQFEYVQRTMKNMQMNKDWMSELMRNTKNIVPHGFLRR